MQLKQVEIWFCRNNGSGFFCYKIVQVIYYCYQDWRLLRTSVRLIYVSVELCFANFLQKKRASLFYSDYYAMTLNLKHRKIQYFIAIVAFGLFGWKGQQCIVFISALQIFRKNYRIKPSDLSFFQKFSHAL